MYGVVLSEPGSAEKANEDWAGFSGRTAVLLDGLTSKSGDEPPACSHGTPWFVHRLGTRLLATVEAIPDLKEALATAIIEVADLHRDTCDVTNSAAPSATVALLRSTPSESRVDYLVIADAMIAFETLNLQSEVISDNRVDEVAKAAQSAVLEQPIGSKEHQEAIEQLIDTQRPLRNTPGGYWIASADPTAAEHSITGSRDLVSLKHAALMSDGASRVVDLFGLGTWHDVFERLEESGPRSLIHTVRAQEQKDPAGEKWPRYKTSDDATIIYVHWEQ